MVSQPIPPEDGRGAGVERLISQVLLAGGLASGVIVAIGLGLFVLGGGLHRHALDLHRVVTTAAADRSPEVLVSVRSILAALRAHPRDPLALIGVGLVLLLITPVLGVIAAVPGFLREGDRRYAAIALIVLAMLVASLLLAVRA